MLSTLLALIKIKNFLSSSFFKIATAILGTFSTRKGKKKFSPIKIIFNIVAIFLIPVFIITFITPTSKTTPTVSQSLIILNSEDRDKYIEAIKNGNAVDWVGTKGNATSSNSSSTSSITGAIDNDYILDFDVSKLTDMDISRIKEYLQVCDEIAKNNNVPTWVIMAINTLESAPINLSDSGVYVGPAQFDGKRTYGSVHPTTGKIVNYTNYGKTEASADGALNNGTYKGPFQISSDYGAGDPYNFVSAGKAAIKAQAGRYKEATKYFKGVTDDTDFLWAVTITMHNTGPGGFYARVPKKGVDTRQHFFNTITKIQTLPNFKDVSERMFKNWSSKENLRDMFLLFDGLEGISYAKEMKEDFGMDNTKSPTYNTSAIKSTPGNTGGKYKGDGGGETAHSQGFKVYMYSDKRGCVIGGVGDTQYGWEFDYEAGRYLFGALTKGKYMENTCRAALSKINGNSSGGGNTEGTFQRIANKVNYYWKDEEMLEGVYNKPTEPTEGLFNEVGYKGAFPIFIQGTSLNEVSKTPWKFAGQSTTLGASGCSLFTLTSLIHGAGFGQDPLPKITNETDGLNDYGYICLQELAKALPNGPVVANDVSSLGYIVKTVPTTDEGLEELYSYLKQGIPFAVNVRYGEITGYDTSYNKHTVHFTNAGHFLLMVGAFELNGRRFVEVVQSTYSNGGQASVDQNTLIFDFDELKEKEIIRSSGGNCVPAYTITGIQGSSKIPNYMKQGYVPPTRVQVTTGYTYVPNDTMQTDISVNSLISSIKETGYINLPKDLYINVQDNYIDIYITDSTYLRISNFKLSNMVTLSSTYKEGTFIGSVNSDTVYEHFEGDTKITQ